MMHATGFWRIAALCAVLLLAGCGSNSGDGSSQGMATVRVGLGTAVSRAAVTKAVTSNPAIELSGVAVVNLTVSAADMATVSVALPLDGSTVTLSIPAGLNRVFSASAYDAGNTLTHSGTTTVAQLVAGMQTTVSLALNAVIPDTTAPAVQSTTPANAATGIATGATIRIVFSEAMNAATVNGANLTVMAPGAVSGSVSYDTATNSALFTPAAALPASTVVNVGLAATLTDVAGNALSGAPYSFSFTTAAAAPTDTTPPTVLAVSPAVGATGVLTGATLSVTFSEAVDCATLSAASFGVSGGSAVVGTVGCSVDTATFTPSASLAGGTTYTATVTTSVKDVAGNPMATVYVWSFTTQPSSGDTVAPTFNGLKIAVPSAVGGNVTLAWDTATDNVTASNAIVYDISVATVAGAPFAATYTTAAGATSYTVGGLTAHIDYYFVVRARDEAGNSDANTVEALTHELMGAMQLRGAPVLGVPGEVLVTYFDTCYIHTLDFGDGSSYTGDCVADQGDVTVSHQYASAGTYTATLTKQTGQSEYITLTITSAAGAGVALHDVTIGAGATSGGTWSGSNPDIYTPNAPGARVSVMDIESRLNAGTSVTITTSPAVNGNGDILVNSTVSWSANALELIAERDVRINAVMTASGTSSLVMTTGTAVFGGTVKAVMNEVGHVGRVDFPGRSGTGFLTIDGGYTVINDVTALQNMCIFSSCKYALGSNIDASATFGWNGGLGFAPVGTGPAASFAAFYGRFDGLGHIITGLVINRPTTDYVGLFGFTNGAKIRNLGLVNGSVSGFDFVGGLVGQTWSSASDMITNSYNRSSVNGSGTGSGSVGGLVGYNYGAINYSYNTGNVVGQIITGGLVGENRGVISNSYSAGIVFGSSFVGGLAGENWGGAISNSYSTGSVSGVVSEVGGLVGYNNGSIGNSYSVGGVTGSASVGGLVGYYSAGTITSSYWDTSVTLAGIGFGTPTGATGLPTAQMKAQASFTGWDFANTWSIVEGVTYPTLRGY